MTARNLFAAALTAALICSAPAHATSTFIDFEGANYSTNPVTQIYDANGLLRGTVSVTGGINEAWIYDTTPPVGADPDLEAPFYDAAQRASGNFDPLSPGNVLIIQENRHTPDDNARGGVMTFEFFNPVDVENLTLLDASRGNVTISAFDADNLLIGTNNNLYNGDTNGAPNFYEVVSLSYLGVTRLELDFSNVSGAVDNIQISAVPLPAAFWLFGSVIAAFGFVARRKQAA
jgi:hypothetical protein